jgi:hypothetical protein
MRHSSRRTFLRALSLVPFASPALDVSARAQSLDVFRRGWNHPWIGYGHDFGRAWGHDGLSTSGWTCETDPSALGFTDSEVTVDPQSGRGALRVRARLIGGDPGRSRGAINLSLADHWPFACPLPDRGTTLNLDGVLVRFRIRLPRGSGGSILQLLLKTRLTAERWPSMHSAPVTISPSWEERDVDISIRVDSRSAAYLEPGFDVRTVSLIGLAVSLQAGGSVDGTVWLDELTLETVRRVVFDFERPEIDTQFGDVRRRKGRGFSLARFFIFCDGRAAPTFAADGSVFGIDNAFYRDFDVLVRAADRHGISLIPVLMDFGWCAYPSLVSGVQLGGHADVIRDPAKRRSFLENALRPLLERYGRHPAILAWEVCNEPEWIIEEIPDAFRRNHELVSRAEMRAFVQSCAAYVHGLTPTQLVTVGGARRKWVQHWMGCDLDFYQFHWFDHFRFDEPLPWGPYDELGLDKPCLVGEVPTDNTRYTMHDFISAAEDGGYAGVMFWSYAARDPFSNMCSLRRPAGPPNVIRRP